MHVVIAGGHGQIALRLERLLAARGDSVAGLVRRAEQAADLAAAGARAVLCDLESATTDELAEQLRGADAVVFAAGAGPGSGSARKLTVDRDAARLLADAAEQAGVRRYLLVSTMGTEHIGDPGLAPEFDVYLQAKLAAEDAVRSRPLDWTVLRPGRLTDAPGTGRVTLAPPPLAMGSVSRDDVAATLVALLDDPSTVHRTLELVGS
ncbi:SDR family oxidoreductase [Kitasatospora cinereorecta]|uniref:SDR family oxidoreductase n=1 Tax=Kitasatospora cinereorecta TaxID=285560 RepID=A0ABW0V7D4_9ACTN